jgi:hypothetical protein
MSDLFADPGLALLERLEAPAPYLARVGSLRRLIDDLDVEIDLFARLIRGRLVADPVTGPCKPSRGSGRSWPRCSWPRSVTCTGSPAQPS